MRDKAFEKILAEKYANRSEDERCAVKRYFEEQAKLPPKQRSSSVMISCPCEKCTPHSL